MARNKWVMALYPSLVQRHAYTYLRASKEWKKRVYRVLGSRPACCYSYKPHFIAFITVRAPIVKGNLPFQGLQRFLGKDRKLLVGIGIVRQGIQRFKYWESWEREAYMRRIEFKVCKKCGKTYRWENGGIVSTPADFFDYGMCPACRVKITCRTLNRVIHIFRGKNGHG